MAGMPGHPEGCQCEECWMLTQVDLGLEAMSRLKRAKAKLRDEAELSIPKWLVCPNPECQRVSPKGSRFCMHCGTPLT